MKTYKHKHIHTLTIQFEFNGISNYNIKFISEIKAELNDK